jgi:hypothetical protein
MYVSSNYYVSSYYYVCVLILLCLCPHTTIRVLMLPYVSSYYYICVLILLHVCCLIGVHDAMHLKLLVYEALSY